ncbi:MAG: hypothetical protein KZQ83_08990 [gamma proteobacterium symbiont of Taylorina sp.]|nr:hypothetical protein [gamma proteobacterium symbiont of Taylorina sp.]
MNNKLSLIIFPVIVVSVLALMYTGYRFSEGFKGVRYCLTEIKNEKPVLFKNLAEIESLNTRLMDQHWISAISFRTRHVEEYEDDYNVTFVCHFEGNTHAYDWLKMVRGNEIERIKSNSTSIVHPSSW